MWNNNYRISKPEVFYEVCSLILRIKPYSLGALPQKESRIN
jgi:hypothetical protein